MTAIVLVAAIASGVVSYKLVVRSGWYRRYYAWVYRFLDERAARR